VWLLFGRAAGCSGSRNPNRLSSLRRNAARHSPPLALPAWSRAGIAAKMGFKARPHMLRHACGFALANKGHDTRALQSYLGHKNSPVYGIGSGRFKNFWRD
jgi:integrase